MLFAGVRNMDCTVSGTTRCIYYVKDFRILFFYILVWFHHLTSSTTVTALFISTVTLWLTARLMRRVTTIACSSNNTVNRNILLLYEVIFFPLGCYCSFWSVLKMVEYVKMSPTETSVAAVLIAKNTVYTKYRRCSECRDCLLTLEV